MIKVSNLEKSYGNQKALKGISLEVAKGELFGLIGPDGAGKTTLMRILVTLLLPDQGLASLDGLDVVADFRKIRTMVGYMPGRFSLYQDLTVEENLQFLPPFLAEPSKKITTSSKTFTSRLNPLKTGLPGSSREG